MDLAEQLGRKIRELREARGMTQEQLAYTSEHISSKGYLSDIESGKRLPSLRTLEDLATRLDVDLVRFFVYPQAGPVHQRLEEVLTRRGSDASS